MGVALSTAACVSGLIGFIFDSASTPSGTIGIYTNFGFSGSAIRLKFSACQDVDLLLRESRVSTVYTEGSDETPALRKNGLTTSGLQKMRVRRKCLARI